MSLIVGGAGEGGRQAAGVVEGGFELFGCESFRLVVLDPLEFGLGGIPSYFVLGAFRVRERARSISVEWGPADAGS
jgi:hypothetical protein